jgi:hypothetical protein
MDSNSKIGKSFFNTKEIGHSISHDLILGRSVRVGKGDLSEEFLNGGIISGIGTSLLVINF